MPGWFPIPDWDANDIGSDNLNFDADLIVTGNIRSPQYESGTAGWKATNTGSAEFNDVIVRGELDTGSITSDPYITIGHAANYNYIEWYLNTASEALPARMWDYSTDYGGGVTAPVLAIITGKVTGYSSDYANVYLYGGATDGSVDAYVSINANKSGGNSTLNVTATDIDFVADGVINFGTGGISGSPQVIIGGGTNTGYIKLPVRATTGDPSSPADGWMYVNTTDNKVRVYADAAWRDLATW